MSNTHTTSFRPTCKLLHSTFSHSTTQWILNLNKTIDKGLLSDSELDSDTEHTSLKLTQTKKHKNQKFPISSLFDSDIEIDTEITEISAEKPTSKTEQISLTIHMPPNQISQTNKNITQNSETFSQNTALLLHHHTNKCNNPFYIKTLASQLQIHTPKTYIHAHK